MTLHFGVIGMSEGNGHPYSWSAIFNGYEPADMEQCGFPVIPRYLEKQNWPDAAISEARVTHIWTQDPTLSWHIARAARIPHVVGSPEHMIGQIDGLLLARDDAATHFCFAAPFLKAGLPVYIDKPICLSLAELERFYELEVYPGQIFTCSALRYGAEFQLSAEDRAAIGVIREIHAITPKDWDRYAVHVIEPLLANVGDVGEIVDSRRFAGEHGASTLMVTWSNGMRAKICAMGSNIVCPLSVRVMGDCGFRDLTFSDAFSAFRAALREFTQGVLHRDCRSDRGFVRRVVQLIEIGRIA